MPQMSTSADISCPQAASVELPPLADRILLIEDSEDDVLQFRRLLAKAKVPLDLDIVTNGETAIRWLTEKIAEVRCGRPVIPRAVFIDLKLPGVLGTEVLRWIRAQPALERTLAVVCSSSEDEDDIVEAERLGAQVYLAKYPEPDRLAALLTAPDPNALPQSLTGYAAIR